MLKRRGFLAALAGAAAALVGCRLRIRKRPAFAAAGAFELESTEFTRGPPLVIAPEPPTPALYSVKIDGRELVSERRRVFVSVDPKTRELVVVDAVTGQRLETG